MTKTQVAQTPAQPKRFPDPPRTAKDLDDYDEATVRAGLAVRWWEPAVAKSLTSQERRFYRTLPWWWTHIRALLPDDAIAHYQQMHENAARRAFPVSPSAGDFGHITDPLERLRQIELAMTSATAEAQALARLRRQTMLEAEDSGCKTSDIADCIKATSAAVRIHINQVKRESGRENDIPPQLGGIANPPKQTRRQ